MLTSGETSVIRAGGLCRLTDRLAKCWPPDNTRHNRWHVPASAPAACMPPYIFSAADAASSRLTTLIDGPSILTRYQRRVCFVSLRTHLPSSCPACRLSSERRWSEKELLRAGRETSVCLNPSASSRNSTGHQTSERVLQRSRRLPTDRQTDGGRGHHSASCKSLVEPSLRVRPAR